MHAHSFEHGQFFEHEHSLEHGHSFDHGFEHDFHDSHAANASVHVVRMWLQKISSPDVARDKKKMKTIF